MKVNDRRTGSMLQRVPVIIAVTAASYGLQLPPQTARAGQGLSSSAAFSQPLQQAGTRAQQEPGRRQA
jgi:hypothetical protein